jgi:hypothetical protein
MPDQFDIICNRQKVVGFSRKNGLARSVEADKRYSTVSREELVSMREKTLEKVAMSSGQRFYKCRPFRPPPGIPAIIEIMASPDEPVHHLISQLTEKYGFDPELALVANISPAGKTMSSKQLLGSYGIGLEDIIDLYGYQPQRKPDEPPPPGIVQSNDSG